MDYKFSNPARKCSQCGKDFIELEKFLSILRYFEPGEKEKLEEANERTDKTSKKKKKKIKKKAEDLLVELMRMDVCEKCWAQFDKNKVLSWWKMQKAKRKNLPALKDTEFLWQLFSQAQAVLENLNSVAQIHNKEKSVPEIEIKDSAEAENIPTNAIVEAEHFAYIAALGLLRLKRLKLKEYKKIEQDEYIVFSVTGGKKTIEVKNPQLDATALRQLEEKIEKMNVERFEKEMQ